MDIIRVGLIRCDTHGMYYAALMDKHDPKLLIDPAKGASHMPYTWQTGGAHFYFYTNYKDRYQMTVPQAEGFKIVKVWDEDKSAAEMLAKVLFNTPEVCENFEQVSDDVDMVFIADCNGDGSDHLRLAQPGIEKAIPTFIDKPFAYKVSDALKLVQLAKTKNVPLLSLSILRTIPQAAYFHDRLKELGEVEFGIIKGFGGSLAAQIHCISLAQHVFGCGVESVECMGDSELAHILLKYGDMENRPNSGVMLNCDSGGGWHASFHVSAYSKHGVIHSDGIDDFHFPYGALNILEMMRQMVLMRRVEIGYDEMVEGIAIAAAARLAQKESRRVLLKDIIDYATEEMD